MKLYVETELPVDPATAWEIFESPEYKERLAAQAEITQEMLEEREEDGVVHRRIRTVPDRELPGMIASLIGASKLSYVQENTFDRAANRLDWKVKLEVLTDKVDVSGSTVVEALPEGGSRRVVDGDITVRVRFVGGQIEKAVVAEFEKSMKRAAEVALDIIEERGLA